MACELVVEPFTADVTAQLVGLHVDHAIAALVDVDDGRVVGFTMCHSAGPKERRLRCSCGRV